MLFVNIMQAALCVIRILRKCPDLMENFVPKVRSLLTEKSHGVLLTGITLMNEMCDLDVHNIEQFRKAIFPLTAFVLTVVLACTHFDPCIEESCHFWVCSRI